MARHYRIIVSNSEESFVAYVADDLDEAEGYAAFCQAELPGMKVQIEQIEWEDER